MIFFIENLPSHYVVYLLMYLRRYVPWHLQAQFFSPIYWTECKYFGSYVAKAEFIFYSQTWPVIPYYPGSLLLNID